VAREYGIPCIVGTGNATKRIKNGDLIILDASNIDGYGVVVIVEG
jgi:phosphohistidine swiveling domain-containing protein